MFPEHRLLWPDLGVPAGAGGTPQISSAPASRLFPWLCWCQRGLWDRGSSGMFPTGSQVCWHGLVQTFSGGLSAPRPGWCASLWAPMCEPCVQAPF